MRRKDREVTDLNEIKTVLEQSDCCRIAFACNNMPYIVTLNYGYTLIDQHLTLYFHSAKEGRKIEMMALNNLVAFEMDCNHNLVANELVERFTMNYHSIVGLGKLSEVNDLDDKKAALNCLMHHYVKKADYEFTRCNEMTLVLKLEVQEFSVKKNQKKL